MEINMKKISIALMLALVATAISFGQEYTVYCSDETQGYITITKDAKAKITIHCKLTKGYVLLSKEICPILPSGIFVMFYPDQNIEIDGNTTTETRSDGFWSKTVVDGNTTTETRSNGFWSKTVVDGNTTTETRSNGFWSKTVVDGNTTTETDTTGYWEKKVVDGNITTVTHEYFGIRAKKVVDGNTTTVTFSDGVSNKTVVVKDGYAIYIHTTGILKENYIPFIK
ncbi:MAG: hypothetical protein LBT01_07330 [Spirochaetaceae bacterium]|jgi:hypothetical protein|nr:hypothetical protein [Spirochaetaceae bacterium]